LHLNFHPSFLSKAASPTTVACGFGLLLNFTSFPGIKITSVIILLNYIYVNITRMNGFYFLARPALALQSALRPQAPQSASLKFVMKYIKNKSYDN
jgi:hypothetical protein